MSEESKKIIALIRRAKFDITNEKRTQADLHAFLERHGFNVRREVRLSDQDIVDFMVGSIAIEIKIKGQRRAILAQLKRYAEHPEVSEILLLTAHCMGLPATIEGKPAAVASLSEGWI